MALVSILVSLNAVPMGNALGERDVARGGTSAGEAGNEEFERNVHGWAVVTDAARLPPGSVRIQLDRAWRLAGRGRHDEALVILDEVPLRDHPDALLLGAQVCHEMGAQLDAVRRLARALQLAPLLLIEIDGDPELRSLVESEGARDVVLDARRRLERPPGSEG